MTTVGVSLHVCVTTLLSAVCEMCGGQLVRHAIRARVSRVAIAVGLLWFVECFGYDSTKFLLDLVVWP